MVLDEMLTQTHSFPSKLQALGPSESATLEVDFGLIADNLKNHNVPNLKCKRLWEQSKRRLRDFQRRESEFLLQARSKITYDFNRDTLNQFPKRLKSYKCPEASNLEEFERETMNLSEQFSSLLFEPNPQQGDAVTLSELTKGVEKV